MRDLRDIYSYCLAIWRIEILTILGICLTTNKVSILLCLPILPESEANVRSNVLMAPKSIAFAVEVGRLDCERSATHVNSWEVTIDMWVKAVRLQGSKVIILTSTM